MNDYNVGLELTSQKKQGPKEMRALHSMYYEQWHLAMGFIFKAGDKDGKQAMQTVQKKA